MHVLFDTHGLEILDSEKAHMNRRIEGLKKFLSSHAQVFIDTRKNHGSQQGDDLFEVSIRIEDGAHRYFTDESRESIRSSFDHAYQEIFRIIRNERSRARTLFRKTGAQFKKIFQRRSR